MTHISKSAFPTYDNVEGHARHCRDEYLYMVVEFCMNPSHANRVDLQMAHHELLCALYEPGNQEAEQQARYVRSLLERMERA